MEDGLVKAIRETVTEALDRRLEERISTFVTKEEFLKVTKLKLDAQVFRDFFREYKNKDDKEGKQFQINDKVYEMQKKFA